MMLAPAQPGGKPQRKEQKTTRKYHKHHETIVTTLKSWKARVARTGVELAAAPAVYFTKQNLDTANVADAVQLIQLDDDAYWCGSARASIVQDRNGTQYCAISMPEYQPPEEQTAGE